MSKRSHSSKGQTLVEFAIVSIALLLIFFVIIELSRILWSWITVQNAARQGARYAITGQFDITNCDGEPTPCDARVASIKAEALNRMTGMALVEGDTLFEDAGMYRIEVYGINQYGELQPDFGGIPNQPVVVRVIYNVGIVTPILNGVVETVPVMGQVTMNNEPFGSLGGINTGVSTAPNIPAIPTAGPTPSPTPSPTHTPTFTPTSTGTVTPGPSPTNTSTPTPAVCNVRFEETLIAGDTFLAVTSDLEDVVTIIDWTLGGQVIGTGIMPNIPANNHLCPAFALIPVSALIANHVVSVESDNGTFDVQTVQAGTSTNTPIPTQTLEPTNTPTPTPSITATPSPTGPFIILNSTCYNGPTVQITVYGYNWPNGEDVRLSFNNSLVSIIPSGHGGIFQRTLNQTGVATGTHEVRATSTTGFDIELFISPCPNVTVTPTVEGATNTPVPADLMILGNPVLVSTPPIISYQPVTFQVTVRNGGEVNVSTQFFVDLFFDVPNGVYEPGDISIPLAYAAPEGYMALSSLNANSSRDIVITAPYGFIGGTLTPRSVYAMVDSVEQVEELDETNNVAGPVFIAVTPGPSPTPRATVVGGDDEISGIAYTLYTSWVPQGRARMFLILVEPDLSRETIVQQQSTDLQTGRYQFLGVADNIGTSYYKVVACFNVDGGTRVGTRSPLSPPNAFANIFMTTSGTGCPYN